MVLNNHLNRTGWRRTWQGGPWLIGQQTLCDRADRAQDTPEDSNSQKA